MKRRTPRAVPIPMPALAPVERPGWMLLVVWAEVVARVNDDDDDDVTLMVLDCGGRSAEDGDLDREMLCVDD